MSSLFPNRINPRNKEIPRNQICHQRVWNWKAVNGRKYRRGFPPTIDNYRVDDKRLHLRTNQPSTAAAEIPTTHAVGYKRGHR